MSGDLTMGAQSRVRGLPTSKVGPRLQGDEAVSQYETVDIISEALQHFRGRGGPDLSDLADYARKRDAQDALHALKTGDTMVKRKPLITVWAENKRSWWIIDMSGRLAAMRLGAMRMGATPCWPQVGSSVWVCLQQHLIMECPTPVSIFRSTEWKTSHMVRPDYQVKSLVFLYLKPL